jgi:hypothetical protein
MTALLIVALACALLCAWRLRSRVHGHECLHVEHSGVHRRELWRRASLEAHIDASGERTFPLPQETRLVLWRCLGLPWRCEVQSLGLPAEVTDHIGSVDAQRFDALFSAPFRRHGVTAAPAAATGR